MSKDSRKVRDDNRKARYLYLDQVKALKCEPNKYFRTMSSEQLSLDAQEKYLKASKWRKKKALRVLGFGRKMRKDILQSVS